MTTLRWLDNTRRWQYAFLFGLSALIASAAIVFGLSIITTVVTLFVLIAGVLNSLLSSGSGSRTDNWLLVRLKRSLNVSYLLKSATVLVWAGTITILYVGASQYYKKTRLINLRGTVVNAAGDPAEGATVYLYLNSGQRDSRAVGGMFTFDHLDLSNEPSRRFRIQAKWQNPKLNEWLETETEIDVSSGRPENIRLVLPPGSPPFKVTYYFLSGNAIDFLIRQNDIDDRLSKSLGGPVTVIPTKPYLEISSLVQKYSESFYGDVLNKVIQGRDQSNNKPFKRMNQGFNESQAASKLDGKPIFAGTWIDSISGDISASDWRNFIKDTSGWNVVMVDSRADFGEPPYYFLFWKFADIKDYRKLLLPDHPKIVDLYSQIIKDSRSPGTGLLVYQYIPGEDSCPGTIAYLIPRYVNLRVAVIENVLDQPIRMGNISIRENNSYGLRSRQDEQLLLDGSPLSEQNYYPQQILTKSDKILIPLELSLAYYDYEEGYDEYEILDLLKHSAVDNKNAADWINKKGSFVISDDSGPVTTLKSDSLLRLLHQPKTDPRLDEDFIFGPSLALQSAELDKIKYPIRVFDPNSLAYYAGYEMGSCPYIYTFSAQSQTWLREGRILSKFDAVQKESLDERVLKRFDGRILIKEEELETSYIDYVAIKLITAEGQELIIPTLQRRLRSIDKHYVVLRKGESVELTFDLPRVPIVQSSVVAKGYYLRTGPS